MDIETGYFFISDITGYTQFLTHSELDHAKEILDALFESILDNMRPPLVLSSTQGDAIIAYVPEGELLRNQSLVDSMESTYFAFRRQLELMDMNTTCDCAACVNMNALDLKIFVHYGEYLIQQIGSKSDLQGSDVILAHRLMKNTVTLKTGLTGYGLLTEAAVEAIGVDGLTEEMVEHTETYEHLGEVKVFIQDLRKVWAAERERRRIFVTPEEAANVTEVFVPVPQWIAWNYTLEKARQKEFFDLVAIERTDDLGGREGIGSAFHCLHRLGDIYYLYVDVDPPNYVTSESQAFGRTSLLTIRVTAVEGGSKIQLLNGPAQVVDPEVEVPQELQGSGPGSLEKLAEIIEQDIEKGIIRPEHLEETSGLKVSLRRPGVAKGRFGNLVRR
jgi:hypothetical protein